MKTFIGSFVMLATLYAFGRLLFIAKNPIVAWVHRFATKRTSVWSKR